MCLFSAILPCPYAEIRDNRQGRMVETKPLRLSLISAYGQGRMVETKPVRLSLILTHGQGRMAENKPLRLSLPCLYGEIRDNCTGLVSAIFQV
jgi:hypothetical protein